jgi:hypothetical protein
MTIRAPLACVTAGTLSLQRLQRRERVSGPASILFYKMTGKPHPDPSAIISLISACAGEGVSSRFKISLAS